MNKFNFFKNLIMPLEKALNYVQSMAYLNLKQRFHTIFKRNNVLNNGILTSIYGDGKLSDSEMFAVSVINTTQRKIKITKGIALDQNGYAIVLEDDYELILSETEGIHHIYITYDEKQVSSGDDRFYGGGIRRPDSIKTLVYDSVTVGESTAIVPSNAIHIADVYVYGPSMSYQIPQETQQTLTSTIKEDELADLSGYANISYHSEYPYILIGDEYVEIDNTKKIVERGKFSTINKRHKSGETIKDSPVIDKRQMCLAKLNLGKTEFRQLLEQFMIKDSGKFRYLLNYSSDSFNDTLLTRLYTIADSLTVDMSDGMGTRKILTEKIPSKPNKVDINTLTAAILPYTYRPSDEIKQKIVLKQTAEAQLSAIDTQIQTLNELNAAATIASTKSEIQAKIDEAHRNGALTDAQYHSFSDVNMGLRSDASSSDTTVKLDRFDIDFGTITEALTDSQTGSVEVSLTNDGKDYLKDYERHRLVLASTSPDSDLAVIEVIIAKYIDDTHIYIYERGVLGSNARAWNSGSHFYRRLDIDILLQNGDNVTIADNSSQVDKVVSSVTTDYTNVVTLQNQLGADISSDGNLSRNGKSLSEIVTAIGDSNSGILGTKADERENITSQIESYNSSIYKESSKIVPEENVRGYCNLTWTEPEEVNHEAIIKYKIKIFVMRDDFDIDLSSSPYSSYTSPSDFKNNGTFNSLIKKIQPEGESDERPRKLNNELQKILNGDHGKHYVITNFADNSANTPGTVKLTFDTSGGLTTPELGELIKIENENYPDDYAIISKPQSDQCVIVATYLSVTGNTDAYKRYDTLNLNNTNEIAEGMIVKIKNTNNIYKRYLIKEVSGSSIKLNMLIHDLFTNNTTVVIEKGYYIDRDVSINEYGLEVEPNQKLVVFIAAINEYGIQGDWSEPGTIDVGNIKVDDDGTLFSEYQDQRSELLDLRRKIEADNVSKDLKDTIASFQIELASKATKAELAATQQSSS